MKTFEVFDFLRVSWRQNEMRTLLNVTVRIIKITKWATPLQFWFLVINISF